jgi:broad specificity phosphatase PhoE
MNETLPVVYLARHGETAWSLSGQHTGLTDLPLTDRGERNAHTLGEQLRGRCFARVFTSPLRRAARTCELTGFGAQANIDRDLLEWNYGEHEGLRTAEIHAKRPDWQLFRHGCPGGESPAEVGARADLVVSRVLAVEVRRSDFFERTLYARINRALAGTGTSSWQILPPAHCELERAQLPAQSVPDCNAALE